MLKDVYLLAKIGADTAENERNFGRNLPTTLPLFPDARHMHIHATDTGMRARAEPLFGGGDALLP